MTTLSTDKYITTSLLSLFQWISEWIKGASCLLCFSLSRQGLEERHKRVKNGHDLNSKTPGLFFYQTLTDINISSRRQSASAQKLSKLTCRSIFKRNRSNILIDQQVTTGSCVKEPSFGNIDHYLQHQHRQCPSVWIKMLYFS